MSVSNFVADLNRWKAKLGPRLDDLTRHVGFECLENIVVGGDVAPGSPVDTGFFRAGWQVGINALPPALGPTTPDDPGADAVLSRNSVEEANLALLGAKAGDVIYANNDTAYGPDLEYGHSQQAPAGMVRLTCANGQAIVDKVARQMKGQIP